MASRFNHGSTAVEAALILGTCALISTFGFFFLGIGFARHWIDYIADEAVVCLESGQLRSRCSQIAHAQLRLLPFGRVTRASIGEPVRIDFQIQKPFLDPNSSSSQWTISRETSGRLPRWTRK